MLPVDHLNHLTCRQCLRSALEALGLQGMTAQEALHGQWRRDVCEALGLTTNRQALSWRDAHCAMAADQAQAMLAASPTPCPHGSDGLAGNIASSHESILEDAVTLKAR